MNGFQTQLRAYKKSAPKRAGEITQIGMENLSVLKKRLAAQKSADTYLISAAYHGFTGRKGLWMYEEGEDFILFSEHPNVPGKLLIFPSISARGAELTRNLLQSSAVAGYEVQLARLPAQNAEETATHLSWTTAGYNFEAGNEHVLDWLHPSHVLSTELVATHAGQKFKDFRKNTHRVDASRITIQALDINAHYFDLVSLSLQWAKDHASDKYSVEDLFEPHAYIIKMLRESGLDLKGSVMFMDDRCVSFAVWEMPASADQPAASVASLSHDGNTKGLSELQYLAMCRALAADGIGRVCIGGSETASLDSYKRKMNPVESFELKSASVTPRT